MPSARTMARAYGDAARFAGRCQHDAWENGGADSDGIHVGTWRDRADLAAEQAEALYELADADASIALHRDLESIQAESEASYL